MTSSRIPNFFIVGSAKSATTSLFFYLNQHPEIFFACLKEPWFFSSDYCKSPSGIDSLEKYLKLFRNAKEQPIVGEASVSYLCFDNVAEKIKKFSPKSKILISLRNPIDRAFSYYSMYEMKGLVKKDFSFYIKNGLNISGIEVFSSGLYYKQVKKYLEIFGHDRVKIIFFKDINNDIKKVLRDICIFLDIDESFNFNTENSYNKTYKPKYKFITKLLYSNNKIKYIFKKIIPKKQSFKILMFIQRINIINKYVINKKQKNELVRYYKEDIKKLSNLLNIDLSNWLS
jgi:hypothetical protein